MAESRIVLEISVSVGPAWAELSGEAGRAPHGKSEGSDPPKANPERMRANRPADPGPERGEPVYVYGQAEPAGHLPTEQELDAAEQAARQVRLDG